MDQTIQLYEEEIKIYKHQVELLKSQNKSSEDRNETLTRKVRDLQDLIEQANVANKDLHAAFDHIRQENLKLQVYTNQQQQSQQQQQQQLRPVTSGNESNELALENVQRQYASLARESVSWISEKDKLSQKVNYLERECERYNRDNSTLSKQVRHLLRVLEEERGMIIRRAHQVTEHNQPLTSIDVIDNNLVTFESIEELQQQNQKLLSLVKKLAKDEEDRETKIENEDIKRLNSNIETLKSQLEDVKNERERIVNSFNMILKERDLFKILLCRTRQVEHMTPEIFQRMVSIACSSGPAITGVNEESNKSKDDHIRDLKDMIAKLEKNLSELTDQYETTKKRSEEEIKMRTELLEQANIKIANEVQQVISLKEHNEILETNIKALNDEFEETRAKNQKMTFELQEMNTIKQRNEELEALRTDSFKEQNRQLENSIQTLTSLITKLEGDLSNLRLQYETLKLQNNHELQRANEQVQSLRQENQGLRGHLEELQRLRNMERDRRLALVLEARRQKDPPTRKEQIEPILPASEPIIQNIENIDNKGEEQRPPQRIILKRRK